MSVRDLPNRYYTSWLMSNYAPRDGAAPTEAPDWLRYLQANPGNFKWGVNDPGYSSEQYMPTSASGEAAQYVDPTTGRLYSEEGSGQGYLETDALPGSAGIERLNGTQARRYGLDGRLIGEGTIDGYQDPGKYDKAAMAVVGAALGGIGAYGGYGGAAAGGGGTATMGAGSGVYGTMAPMELLPATMGEHALPGLMSTIGGAAGGAAGASAAAGGGGSGAGTAAGVGGTTAATTGAATTGAGSLLSNAGSLAKVAAPLIGGLLGSQGSQTSETRRNEIDPRMARYLYGEDGNGGLLGAVSARYNANPSGINQQMLDGWNRQWNTLTDPSIAAGYQGMRQTGNALMQLPIAGNPFTQPGGYSRSMFGGGGNQGPQRQPAGQFGPPPGFNPSQQRPSDIEGLYSSIGRTGEKAPNAEEIAYWRNKGLTGDQLRRQFLHEAANFQGQGFDPNKQMAQGLLSQPPRAPIFGMPQY